MGVWVTLPVHWSGTSLSQNFQLPLRSHQPELGYMFNPIPVIGRGNEVTVVGLDPIMRHPLGILELPVFPEHMPAQNLDHMGLC